MGKPLKIEKNKNGKTTSSTTERNILYSVDPDDQDYNETLGNARRKLERPMAAAMPCKRPPNGITKVTAKPEIESEKNSKTVHG